MRAIPVGIIHQRSAPSAGGGGTRGTLLGSQRPRTRLDAGLHGPRDGWSAVIMSLLFDGATSDVTATSRRSYHVANDSTVKNFTESQQTSRPRVAYQVRRAGDPCSRTR